MWGVKLRSQKSEILKLLRNNEAAGNTIMNRIVFITFLILSVNVAFFRSSPKSRPRALKRPPRLKGR